MWAFWVQLLQFFLENAILKWKLALIQKCIVIFEIVYNEKHGKWYNLLTLLISISQIWTFSCKNLEKIVVYVMPYLKCPPNLKLIIFKLSNCSDSFLLPLVEFKKLLPHQTQRSDIRSVHVQKKIVIRTKTVYLLGRGSKKESEHSDSLKIINFRFGWHFKYGIT